MKKAFHLKKKYLIRKPQNVAYCTGERKTIENNIINKGGGSREKRSFSLKGGGHPFYIFLSIVGVIIGLALLMHGLNGGNLGSGLLMAVGIFVVIKEILDIFH